MSFVRTYGLTGSQQEQVWARLRGSESIRSIAHAQPAELQRMRGYSSGPAASAQRCRAVQSDIDGGREAEAPWQRGSNKTSRLLRQYLSTTGDRRPATGDLRSFDQATLDAIATRITNRPGGVLGWWTPVEVLADYRPF